MDVAQFKQGQRRVWASGDFPDIAKHIESASGVTIAAAGVTDGDAMLDIACGTGNAAIPAAELGARVTALDFTPELLAVGRERAQSAGVSVDWVEGDAEDLPFADDSFDRVISVFGCMFAPRHAQAASEIVRVCKPGGKFSVAAWTPDGQTGRMLKLIGGKMPPPPPEVQPPILWGDESYTHSLFAAGGAGLEYERRMVEFTADSVSAWMDYSERVLGPMIMAKAALEPRGEWEPLRGALVALHEEHNKADDGTMRVDAEYLVTTGTLPD